MKPKYNFFKNTTYALDGIKIMVKNETAFKIELCIIIPLVIISFFLKISFITHLILIMVLFLILITESLNSAIESCVNLITQEIHPLAKTAKDCASAAVFFSITLAVIVWISTIFSLL